MKAKKITALLMAAVMTVSLAACGNSGATTGSPRQTAARKQRLTQRQTQTMLTRIRKQRQQMGNPMMSCWRKSFRRKQ